MAVLLFVLQTLFLSMKMVETHFLPPSIMLKWRGWRGLVMRLEAEAVQLRLQLRSGAVRRVRHEDQPLPLHREAAALGVYVQSAQLTPVHCSATSVTLRASNALRGKTL